MSLFDTLFPRQSRNPGHRSQDLRQGRSRFPSRRNRLRELGNAEQLERRDLLAVTVVQETPTTFFTDFSRNFDSEYASYTITNGEATPIDAWVKVTFPAGSQVGVGPGYNNEDGVYRIGTLAASNPGDTDAGEAFLYYTAKSNTTVPQPYSLEVWNGKPGEAGSVLLTPTPIGLQYDSVINTLAAEPNKVNKVTISSDPPTVGDPLFMVVEGKLGSGANRVLFAPANRSDWQPDVFELRTATHAISGISGLTQNRLFYDNLPGGGSNEKSFVSTYEFLITGPVATPTPVSPTQWTQDGNQPWKHHQPDAAPFPPIAPVKYDLSISKIDDTGTYKAGETTVYTVTIQNTGNAGVSNVLVTDVLPAQIDPTSTTWTVAYTGGASSGVLPGGLGNGGTGNISGTVNLPAKTGAVTITINALVLPGVTGAIINTVSATAPGDQPISASVTIYDINLSLTKDDGKTTYVPGGETTYTIVLQNTGTAAITPEFVGITLDDDLPSQIDPTSTWTASYSGGALSGPGPNGLGDGGTGSFLGKTVDISVKGATVTITINAKILSSATGQMINKIEATLPAGGPPLSAIDENSPAPDERLTLTKDNGQTKYIPGTTTTYTITLSNIGLSDVNGIVISDTLPAQLDALTTTWFATYEGDGTLSKVPTTGDILGTVNKLKGSVGVVTITINGVILSTATGDMVNTVDVRNSISLSSTDRDTADPQVDLAVTKTRTSPLPVIAGESVTYTITVTNNGPSAITTFSGVDVTDPALLSPTYTVDNGTYNPDTKTWTADASDFLTPGEVLTFTLTGIVPADATGTLTNTATATTPLDPNPRNNTSTATDTIVVKPVLTVTKTDESATYIPGNPVIYTIVVTNTGPSFLTGGTVVDALPSMGLSGSWTATTSPDAPGLPVNKVTPSSSPLGVNDINATVDLAPGSFATFLYTVQTKPIDVGTGLYPDLFNKVEVFPPAGTAGNTTTATDNDTAAPQVDLAVTKTRTSPLPVIAGEVVTYSIVVTSNGPSSIKTFTGTDISVPGLLLPTYSVSTGTYNPSTGTWTANSGDTFDKGESVTFTFSGTVPANATGTLTNTATATPPVFDPDPKNNTSTATDTIVVSPVLKITKTANPAKAQAGQGGYKFQITVTNSGPSDAQLVSVVDTMPLGFKATAFSPLADVSPIAPTVGPFTWKIGALAAGATTILDITYEVAADVTEGTKINTAVVKIGDEVKGTATCEVEVGIGPPISIGGALVVGSDDGCNGPPWVRVLDPNSGEELSRFLAYDARFRGSVRVATGDVTGDGVAEIITAPGRNAVGEVRVFQRNLVGAAQQNNVSEWTELTQYRTLAFGPGYRGGVEVAVADIDGDLDNDIVTGMSIRTGMVNVFRVTPGISDPVANAPFKSFRGAPAGTNNGVMISAGDYILGGPAEIAVGTNSGTRALVRVFDVSGTPTVVRSFKPFANNFRGGVTLSTSDYDGNGSLDLIVGAGINGGSRVEVWNPSTTTRIAQVSAFSSLAKPNARVFAVFGSAADGFIGPDSTLYGAQGLNGGRGSKGVWKVLGGAANPLVDSQTSLPPLRIAPIALQFG